MLPMGVSSHARASVVGEHPLGRTNRRAWAAQKGLVGQNERERVYLQVAKPPRDYRDSRTESRLLAAELRDGRRLEWVVGAAREQTLDDYRDDPQRIGLDEHQQAGWAGGDVTGDRAATVCPVPITTATYT